MDVALIYILTGAAAGLLAGLLGIGGGLVIVPVLAFHFAQSGLAVEHLMHTAIGTSLATIVVTALSSVLAHHRKGAVDWRIAGLMTPGLIAGALCGAVIADHLATGVLKRLFGIFELAVAAQLGFGLRPAGHRRLPGRLGLMSAGALIGAFSSLMGIGGGTLTVPMLLWCGVTVRRAVAVSAACGLPIALAGAFGFAAAGWGLEDLQAGSSGYLYWPAFAGIAVASVLCAPIGAALAHRLPGRQLRRLFAIFLAFVGLKMLLG